MCQLVRFYLRGRLTCRSASQRRQMRSSLAGGQCAGRDVTTQSRRL